MIQEWVERYFELIDFFVTSVKIAFDRHFEYIMMWKVMCLLIITGNLKCCLHQYMN